MAAVIGSEVSWPLLYTLMERAEDGLQHSLQHLQATEFLYETRPVPAPTYTFTHALVQEAAYSSLLPKRRRTLHTRIVEAIEQRSPARLDGEVERLAHHALGDEV